MLRTAIAAGLALAVAGPRAARAWTRERALVFIDSRAADLRLEQQIAPMVLEILKAKGYDATAADIKLAIDGAGAANPAAVRLVAQRAKADAVVTVNIEFSLDAHERPRGPEAKRAIGMLARMYRPDARVAWRNSLATILEEPALVSISARAAAFTRRREQAVPAASPARTACEQLLWTLPRAKPSPDELAAHAAPPPLVLAAPPTSTRPEFEPDRARDFGATARFPLRIDRSK